MTGKRPTVRSIARALGLSRSTVSNALRGLPTVKPSTRLRVEAKAAALGYSQLPFASEVMSRLRRRGGDKAIGTVAIVELAERDRPAIAKLFNGELVEGISQRAAEIGFAASVWHCGPGQVPPGRLNQILQWRGIHALVLLPAWHEPDFTGLDWTNFTGIYVDYLIRQPAINTVCSDHYRRIFDAMDKVRHLGFLRAGLVLERRQNERLHGRFVGAYLNYVRERREMALIPPLLVEEFDGEQFLGWFRRYKPEVVMTHWLDAPKWMARAGARIPQTHGYICLSLLGAPPGYSGFDVQPRLLGARAAELVISQLGHHERGVPAASTNTSLPAVWVEGTTILARK